KNKLEKLKEESKKAEENKVFIERAEPLTIEGIRAMSLSDEDYEKYRKKKKAEENKKEMGGK
ncbi:MAG: hypothetical protein WC781_05845, partial [Candidatus Pacearchaeota archaeon]